MASSSVKCPNCSFPLMDSAVSFCPHCKQNVSPIKHVNTATVNLTDKVVPWFVLGVVAITGFYLLRKE